MKKNRLLQMVLLCTSIVVVLACNLGSGPAQEQPDPSVAETEVQLRVIATSFAIQQMTQDAAQAQITPQVPADQPVQPTIVPTEPPVQNLQVTEPPTRTVTPPPAELVLDIQFSVREFYCYQSPYELTITVTVSDINQGMAVYYRIQDKNSGVASDWQNIDLHRNTSNTRVATIIGGGSDRQNLQFPPLMGESYFIYQIISDDGKYRTPAYSDITFHPCGQ